MIVTVLIHETGHLFFGLLTGYRPVLYKILWFRIEAGDNGIRLRVKGIYPFGQCLMYPVKADAFPVKMILGGPLFNLIFGLLFLALGMLTEGLIIKIIFLYNASFNIAIGIYNLLFGSVYSDGKALAEIKEEREAGVVYNNLLLIYRYLFIGKSYADMPVSLFVLKEEHTGAIYEELKEHRHFKEIQMNKER